MEKKILDGGFLRGSSKVAHNKVFEDKAVRERGFAVKVIA